jgi:hypothetical protein
MFVLSRLVVVWKFMLMNAQQFADSYRVALTKERVVGPFGAHFVTTLCFWCLNPQVAFFPVSAQCRSVILASGMVNASMLVAARSRSL